MNTISSFSNCKLMLSVTNFLFEGSNVRIQGTNEDPLFHCLDIVKILGCMESNQNKFYQKNKNSPDFVLTIG